MRFEGAIWRRSVVVKAAFCMLVSARKTQCKFCSCQIKSDIRRSFHVVVAELS